MRTAQTLAKLFLALSLCLPFHPSLTGQTAEDDSLEQVLFYPGISAVVLQKDAMEINVRNSLTTYWLAIREYVPALRATMVADRSRYTFLEHSVQASRGFSRSGRWDLGLELRYAQVRNDPKAGSSPWLVLGSDSEGGALSAQGISRAGIRARYLPFERVPELTLQGSLLFRVAKDFRTRRNLNADRIQSGIATTYFRQLFSKSHLFLFAEWRTSYAHLENDRTTHAPTLGAYLVKEFGRKKLYALGGLTYSRNLERLYSGGRLHPTARYVLGFAGLQYQPGRKWSVYLNTQIPFVLDSGSTYQESVKNSFSSWSLGARLLL